MIVLGPVHLEFQGQFVPISLRLVFGTVAAWVMGTVLVIMELTSSTWGFSICKTAHRIWLRILSIVLEKELKILDYA